MNLSRRDFAKLAVAAVPAAPLLAKPNSNFKGVQIGAITYCFRTLPTSAQEVLKYCTDLGLSSIELMGDVAERYAGAPSVARAGGGGKKQQTPEQRDAVRKSAEDLKKWRTSAPIDKFKAFRAMYNDA